MRRPIRDFLIAFFALSIGVAGFVPGPVSAQVDERSTVSVTKSNDLGGEPVQPGDEFNWRLELACTSIEVDCVGFEMVDVIPDGFDIDPAFLVSNALFTSTFDEGTRELRIAFHESLDNPPGELGWTAGSNLAFDLAVTLRPDAPYLDGAEVLNTATVTAENAAESDSDDDLVTIEVPRIVDATATKQVEPPGVVTGTGAEVTASLGVGNTSSTSADIGEISVTDTSVDFFDHFDLTGVSVTSFPAGADTAQLEVCTAAASGCPPAAFESGPSAAGATPFPLGLPTGVDAAEVTGIRIVFSASSGDPLPHDAVGGGVDATFSLRDALRSDPAEPIAPLENLDLDNCAVPAATDRLPAGPEVTEGDPACATVRVFPDVLVLTPEKRFFADGNGDFDRDADEYAVIDEGSGVTAIVDVTNDSPFPISEITIAEPGPGAEFDKVDVDVLGVTLPAGAATATVVITYDDGSEVTEVLTTDGDLEGLRDAGNPIVGIEVTFAGEGGEATFEPDSTASLAMHGTLTGEDASDIPSGADPAAGVVNCADVTGDAGRGDGTGVFAGTACATLPVEERNASGEGVKSASQTTIPDDQPVTFTLRVENDGNLPLIDPVITDPSADGAGEPSDPNPFDSLEILDASVTKSSGTPNVIIEVFVPGTGWVDFDSAGSDLPDATGIRARMDGNLTSTRSFTLRVVVQRRAGVDDGLQLLNCFSLAAGGPDFEPTDPTCAPAVSTGPGSSGASLIKNLAPGELPLHVPGLPPQRADITLRVRNTGTLSASYLQIVDEDPDFFDAFDLTSIESIDLPDGADQVRLDALVGGVWVDGTPASVATAIASFDADHDLEQVRGIRITFSSSSTFNDGYLLTPCGANSCEGEVVLRVATRPTLVSDPGQRPEGTIEDTASGSFETRLDTPGVPTPIGESSATVSLVPGTPGLDVEKSPGSVSMIPGVPQDFDLVVQNSGTANIAGLEVVDVLDSGLTLDLDFDGDDGQPYEIVDATVPDGTPPPPTPLFTTTPDPSDSERVAEARWEFPGPWVMAPGTSITLRVRVLLHPGVTSGEELDNTLAAGSASEPDLECSDERDGTSSDGTHGDGNYCTDVAEARVLSGAAFNARKWVAGNPALGWYHNGTGSLVPLGDPSCPSFERDTVLYTSTPCIALLNPGDQHRHLLRVRNAGTEPALHMTVVDRLPVAGDEGVLVGDRGTQWDQRPTLATPLTVTAPGSSAVGYTASEPLCTDDLVQGGASCPPGAWDDLATFGDPAAAAGFQVDLDMDAEPLAPGAAIEIAYVMDTPFDVAENGRPTIAWNSFAHAETTQTATGGERTLTPIEPIKVGVALSYGTLEVAKAIGENSGGLPVGSLTYGFAYRCVSTPIGATDPVVVAEGALTAAPGDPGSVDGIPAGSVCSVWETETNGGVPSATEADPAIVTIEPRMEEADPVTSSSVTNDFPLGELSVTKSIVGDVDGGFTAGPFTVEIDCQYADAAVEGFPTTVEFDEAGTASPIPVPVGSECSVTETVTGGATDVIYEPVGPATGRSAVVTVPAEDSAEIAFGIVNEYVPGSIRILKSVEGAGAPAFSGGPFTFDVSCDFDGSTGVFETTVVLDGSEDGALVVSDPIDGLADGAVCAVTEVDAGGADATAPPVSVTVVGDETADAAVANVFSASTVEVTKDLDGDAADYPAVQDLRFSIRAVCERDEEIDGSLERVTWLDATVDVDGSAPVTVLGPDDEPAIVPVGSRCWAEEVDTQGAAAVRIDASDFDSGVLVEASPDGEIGAITLSVTNTFEAATLIVSKDVVNGDPDREFDFAVSCTVDGPSEATPSPILDGTDTFSLADGEATELTVVSGAGCSVSEIDAPADAEVTIRDDSEDPADGEVVASGQRRIAFTNTFPAEPRSGAVGGALAMTGAGLGLLTVVGGALLAVGFALRRQRSARTR